MVTKFTISHLTNSIIGLKLSCQVSVMLQLLKKLLRKVLEEQESTCSISKIFQYSSPKL